MEFAYNDMVHSSTGYTPFEMNYGKHPRGVQQLLFETAYHGGSAESETAYDMWSKLHEIMQKARANMQKAMERLLERDTGSRKEEFERGDQVLVHKRRMGESVPQEKLADLYVGPYMVLRKVGGSAYLLALPPGIQIDPVINIRDLKRYPLTKDESTTGGSKEIKPRLGDKLIINNMYMVRNEPVHELIAQVKEINYSVGELINRGHFEECHEYLRKHYHAMKLPTILGRVIRKKFDEGIFEGIIVAWDPSESNKMFEIGYSDQDSEWISEKESRESRRLVQKPPRKKGNIEYSKLTEKVDKLKMLVLCSGTKSVEKAMIRQFGDNIEITSVDIAKKHNPDLIRDIIQWKYEQEFNQHDFDIIWASPECKQYSKAHTLGIRVYEEADSLVTACLRIIKFGKPKIWVIENPMQRLSNREFMVSWNKYKHECSYCCYGFWYRKHTDIWTNVKELTLRKCTVQTPCEFLQYARNMKRLGEYMPNHPFIGQKGYSKANLYQSAMGTSENLYRIPDKLVMAILKDACYKILTACGS